MTTRNYESEERMIEVLKNALWLAWQAAGPPMGMGVLQNNPSADKEAVWQNANTSGDYPGGYHGQDNSVDADYVFGRMLKLHIRYDAKSITPNDGPLARDYQAWCGVYPTYDALIDAAEKDS